jgi:hypothetical protein
VTLVRLHGGFEVCANNRALITSPDTVKSVLDLWAFVFAREGKVVAMSNHNVKGLSLLCPVFGCGPFAEESSHFRESSHWKEAVIEEETKFKIQMQFGLRKSNASVHYWKTESAAVSEKLSGATIGWCACAHFHIERHQRTWLRDGWFRSELIRCFKLSVHVLDELLSGASFSIVSEDTFCFFCWIVVKCIVRFWGGSKFDFWAMQVSHSWRNIL